MKVQVLLRSDFFTNEFYNHLSKGVKYYQNRQFHRAIEELNAADRLKDHNPVHLSRINGGVFCRSDLSEVPVLFFLWAIYTNELSGIGYYKGEAFTKRFLFQKGLVVYAETSSKEERIGNYILRRRPDITEEKLDELVVEAKEAGQKLGEHLVEKDLLTWLELQDILSLQITETLSDSFFWRSGQVYFLEKEVNENPIVVYSPLKIAALAAQRRFNVINFRNEIPNNKVIFRSSPYFDQIDENVKNKLNANELFILSLIDGFRNIDQLIKFSGADEVSVINILYRLSRLGLIRKTKEIGEYEDKEFQELSKILELLRDVFQLITRKIFNELGVKGSEIIHNARNELKFEYKILFNNVTMDDPEKFDINKILNNIASNYPSFQDRFIFIEAFHILYLNILKELKRFLGQQLTAETVEQIRRVKSDIDAFAVDTDYKKRLVEVLDDINTKFG